MSKEEESVGHGVRAMAFWHQDGLDARRALARTFGGPDGRIATVPDLVDARLATPLDAYPWSNSIVSETRVYVGLDFSGRLLAVVTQDAGPAPMHLGMVVPYGGGPWGRPAIRRGEFVRMLEMEPVPGQVVIDLEEYAAFVAAARYGKYDWDARLSGEQAMRDPMLRAIFGDRLEAYMGRLMADAREWMGKDEVFPFDYDGVSAFTRVDQLRKDLNDQDATYAAFVYRVELVELMRHAEQSGPPAFPRDFRCMVQTRRDDFVDEQFHGYHAVVGVRPGNGPITGIARPLDAQREKVFAQWRAFAGPIVPDTPITESGNRLRELLEWRGTYFAIAERVCCGGRVPGARAVTATQIPVDLPIRAAIVKKGEGSWSGMVDEAIEANAPEGANAYVSDGGEWVRSGEDYSHIDVRVRYFRVEFDETPMHFLMRVGSDLFTQYPYPDKERPRGTKKPHAWASSAQPIGRAKKLKMPTDEETQRDAWLSVTALRAQAPAGANAVLLDENGWYGKAQFYRVEIDHAFGWPHWNDVRADVHGTARRLESLGLT